MSTSATLNFPNQCLKTLYYCSKCGDGSVERPLNIVCLDPICRSDPLICSSCLASLHKYHQTIPLSQFLSEYQAKIRSTGGMSSLNGLIQKQYENVKRETTLFKNEVMARMDEYLQSLEQYFCFLQNGLFSRERLSKSLGIELDPKVILERLQTAGRFSKEQLSESIVFIMKHCLFYEESSKQTPRCPRRNESNLSIRDVSSLLKYDEGRVRALLDEACNKSQENHCSILKALDKLKTHQRTMGKEYSALRQMIERFNSRQLEDQSEESVITNPQTFLCKESLQRTIGSISPKTVEPNQFTDHRKCLPDISLEPKQRSLVSDDEPLFEFGKHKHDMLTIRGENRSVLKSNITALKPQFALICPTLDYSPQKEQNFSVRIKECRNLASKNTLAIGLCSLSPLKANSFESENDQSGILLTSQGYLLRKSRQEKTNFTFSKGDILNFKYDPYYKLLIVRKESNGRKLTIKTEREGVQDPLYACVRMTYASDEVQILNHKDPSLI